MVNEHLYKFKNETEYNSAVKNHMPVPNISYIAENGKVYINSDFTTKENAEAGDLIVYHKTGETEDGKILYDDVRYMKAECFNKDDSYWTTDAIVVVPYSHTGDGTVRAMAVNYATIGSKDGEDNVILDPAKGYTNDGAVAPGIVWGSNTDIVGIDNYTSVVGYSDNNWKNDAEFTVGLKQNGYLPSDAFVSGTRNPKDPKTNYTGSTNIPSPYDAEGNRNDAYFSRGIYDTEEKSLNNNVLKEIDGALKTYRILNTIGSANLENALKSIPINNNGWFPAATACARYSSALKPFNYDFDKTLLENYLEGNMPWYLPSAGELGYMIVRWGRIKYALEQLGKYNYSEAEHWSSSEYSGYNAWYLRPSDGYVYGISRYKSLQFRVRPFAAF